MSPKEKTLLWQARHTDNSCEQALIIAEPIYMDMILLWEWSATKAHMLKMAVAWKKSAKTEFEFLQRKNDKNADNF